MKNAVVNLERRKLNRMGVMYKTIGDYFRTARVQAKLSVEAVCEHTGLIEHDQLISLEAGTYRPPLDTLFGLVNTYNLNPDEFIELLYKLASDMEALMTKAKKSGT